MLTLLITLAVAGAIALLNGLASDELYASLPRFTAHILRFAVARIRDESLRERAAEEWSATIADVPGHVTQFIHAVSFLASARRIERAWESDDAILIDESGLETFAEQVKEKLDGFATKLRAARESRNLSVSQLSTTTCIPVRTLRALEQGRFADVPSGIFIHSWLKQIGEALGLDPESLADEFWDLLSEFNKEEILPPSSSARGSQRKIKCALMGHVAKLRLIHSRVDGRFHWKYYECERCGQQTGIETEFCSQTKIRQKKQLDSGIELVFTCEHGWPVYRRGTVSRAVEKWFPVKTPSNVKVGGRRFET